jgi:hypothetical protein
MPRVAPTITQDTIVADFGLVLQKKVADNDMLFSRKANSFETS